MFKDGRANYVHEEERSGLPSVVSYDLVQRIDQKICKSSASKFQNFQVYFRKFHTLFSTKLST
jgi:hypothetical protein